LDELKEILGL
jgi:hypothetical protein